MTSTDTRITSRVGRGPSPFRDDRFSQPQQDHPAVIEKGDLIRVRKPSNANSVRFDQRGSVIAPTSSAG